MSAKRKTYVGCCPVCGDVGWYREGAERKECKSCFASLRGRAVRETEGRKVR